LPSTDGDRKVVFFDLDGTLLDGPSSERGFILFLLKRGRLGPRQIVSMLGFPLRHMRRFRTAVLARNKAYLNGLRVEEVATDAQAFVAQVVEGRISPPVLARLTTHRRAKDVVVLLTGAPAFIAQPLAERLEVDQVVATRCAIDHDRYTNEPPVSHPYGSAKRRLAEEVCRERGSALEAATAYADSWQDRALLRAVGRPIAVAPDRRLRRLARRLGWETFEKMFAEGKAHRPTEPSRHPRFWRPVG